MKIELMIHVLYLSLVILPSFGSCGDNRFSKVPVNLCEIIVVDNKMLLCPDKNRQTMCVSVCYGISYQIMSNNTPYYCYKRLR